MSPAVWNRSDGAGAQACAEHVPERLSGAGTAFRDHVQAPQKRVLRARPGLGTLSSERFGSHDPHCKQVASFIAGLAARLLGRHVAESPDHRPGRSEAVPGRRCWVEQGPLKAGVPCKLAGGRRMGLFASGLQAGRLDRDSASFVQSLHRRVEVRARLLQPTPNAMRLQGTSTISAAVGPARLPGDGRYDQHLEAGARGRRRGRRDPEGWVLDWRADVDLPVRGARDPWLGGFVPTTAPFHKHRRGRSLELRLLPDQREVQPGVSGDGQDRPLGLVAVLLGRHPLGGVIQPVNRVSA
jgi:hypothetical protein